MKQIAPAKWRFNHSDFHLPKYYKDYQFTRITINSEKCTLCTACQKLCEKNCFDLSDEVLVISPQNCSSCQLCVDTCPEKAITVEDKISRTEIKSHPIYERVCAVCNKTYKTVREHDEKCVACKKREGFSRR
jgi:NAD-dependent dihydropyrimidine dehydrogenase PreA subunit